jgi:hypothetical protein
MRRPRRSISVLFALALVVSVVAGAGQPPQVARAAGTIVVGNGCTLADAITSANTDTATGGCVAGDGADTIVLEQDAVYTLTTPAEDDGYLGYVGLPIIVSDITIDGNESTIQRDAEADPFRIMAQTGGTLTLNQVTLKNGNTVDRVGPSGSGWGGCLSAIAGTLIIHESMLLDCYAGQDGSSLETSNQTVTVTSSTFSSVGGFATIRTSTSNLTMTNSTVAATDTSIGLVTAQDSQSTLTNVTIADATAYAIDVANGSTVTVRDSILHMGDRVVDDQSTLHYEGAVVVPTNVDPADSPLNPLADNGGPTLTMLPRAGLGVIDEAVYCLPVDQRGVTRPQGENCDVGAVELEDSTPPVITPVVTGTLGNNGWYTSDVSLTWTRTENESRITSSDSVCLPATLADDTSGIVYSCSASSVGGTTTQSVTIKRDATGPTLSPIVTPNPVAIGQTATASPNATDTTSGIASQSCDTPDTSTFGPHTVECRATDNAGNTTTVQAPFTVSDPSAPSVTALVTGTLGNNGWYTSDVHLVWQVTDAESPITSPDCGTAIIAMDTTGVEQTCTATSGGGTTTQSVTIKRDTIAPTVTLTRDKPVYGLTDTVTLTCVATDATSGLATDPCANLSGPASSFKPGGNTVSVTAVDLAGNTTSASVTFTIGVTWDSLCTLTQQLDSNTRAANTACSLLRSAQTYERKHILWMEALMLNAYRAVISNEVRAGHISTEDGAFLIAAARKL